VGSLVVGENCGGYCEGGVALEEDPGLESCCKVWRRSILGFVLPVLAPMAGWDDSGGRGTELVEGVALALRGWLTRPGRIEDEAGVFRVLTTEEDWIEELREAFGFEAGLGRGAAAVEALVVVDGTAWVDTASLFVLLVGPPFTLVAAADAPGRAPIGLLAALPDTTERLGTESTISADPSEAMASSSSAGLGVGSRLVRWTSLGFFETGALRAAFDLNEASPSPSLSAAGRGRFREVDWGSSSVCDSGAGFASRVGSQRTYAALTVSLLSPSNTTLLSLTFSKKVRMATYDWPALDLVAFFLPFDLSLALFHIFFNASARSLSVNFSFNAEIA
jgi:hypothetical protein